MRARLLSALLACVVVGCGNQRPPPPTGAATVSCRAQVQICQGGVSMDNKCLAYGAPTPLIDSSGNDVFGGGCVHNSECSSDAIALCNETAKARCHEPECKLVASSASVVACPANSCVDNSPPGFAVGVGLRPPQGQKVPDNPSAPFRILSFDYTTASGFIQQNPPTRTTDLDATLGQPVGIDAAGYLDVITNAPNTGTIMAFDLAPDPPKLAISPLALAAMPNVFALADAPLLLGNTVVGDVFGVSLYDVKASDAKRTKAVGLGGAVVGLDIDPHFDSTNTVSALTVSPNLAQVVQIASGARSRADLPGKPVDVTTGSDDVWVISSQIAGSGTITRIGNPTGAVRAEQVIADGEPVAIGGASGVNDTIPGGVAVLIKTATGGEIRVFLGGNLTASPTIVPLTGFPLAEPKTMHIVTIDNTQYAWVALLVGTKNIVSLYNLATHDRVAALDVDLNAFEPLQIVSGVPDNPDPDVFSGTQTAFLHVLVKSN